MHTASKVCTLCRVRSMSASTLMKRIGKISNKSKMESLVQVKL